MTRAEEYAEKCGCVCGGRHVCGQPGIAIGPVMRRLRTSDLRFPAPSLIGEGETYMALANALSKSETDIARLAADAEALAEKYAACQEANETFAALVQDKYAEIDALNAKAEALAEALEHYASERHFGADGDVARDALARYRGENPSREQLEQLEPDDYPFRAAVTRADELAEKVRRGITSPWAPTGKSAHGALDALSELVADAEALAEALEEADHYLYRHGWTKQGVEGARGIIRDALARHREEKP